jgi:hypothetical protein
MEPEQESGIGRVMGMNGGVVLGGGIEPAEIEAGERPVGLGKAVLRRDLHCRLVIGDGEIGLAHLEMEHPRPT